MPRNDTITKIITHHATGKKEIKKFTPYKLYDFAYVGIPTFCVLDFFKKE
jgi:hypothetical protein